jgi:hypothetical protein
MAKIHRFEPLGICYRSADPHLIVMVITMTIGVNARIRVRNNRDRTAAEF